MEKMKKTKAMYFEDLRNIVMDVVRDEERQDELIEFIDRQIAALDTRKAAAARRAERRRLESDAFTEAILAQIGDDLITVNQIILALDDETVTRNKVTARLGKLYKSGLIVKEQIRVDGNKRMAYRLATEEDIPDEDEYVE